MTKQGTVFVSTLSCLVAFAAGGSLEERFEILDADGDGVVTPAEADTSFASFRVFDFNGDARVDREELERYEKGDRLLEDGLELLAGIVYRRRGERELTMDILRPRYTRARLPVVMWIHGGGWDKGSKRKGADRLVPLVKEGYVGVSIEYRLSDEAVFPAQLEDCKCAVRFLRAHAEQYGINPDRIGAWGSSAGGHLAALLGTSGGVDELEGKGPWQEYSSRVQAVCDWYGPSDLFTVGRHVDDTRDEKLLGGEPYNRRELALLASPVTHASADDPPFLIMHGTKDRVVPYKQSKLLKGALKRQGVKVHFVKVRRAGHGGERFDDPALMNKVVRFFNRYLQP